MPQEIIYCDRCSQVVSQADVARGLAILGPNFAFCASCASLLPADQRALLAGGAVPAAPTARPAPPRVPTPVPRHSERVVPLQGAPSRSGRHSARSSSVSGRRRAPSFREQPGAGGGSTGKIVMVGLGAGLVAGLVAVAVLMSEAEKAPPPTGQPSAEEGGEAQAPVSEELSALQGQDLSEADCEAVRAIIASIEARIDPTLTAYEGIRRDLLALGGKTEGTRMAAEVASAVARVDSDYANLAEEALEEAKEAARELVSRGDVDTAASLVRSVRGRFSLGPWLESGGSAAIDAALQEVEGARDSSAKVALAMADDALGRGDLGAARKALDGRSSWPEEHRKRADDIIRNIDEREKKTAAKPADQGAKPAATPPSPKPAAPKPKPVEEPVSAELSGGPREPLPGETGKPGQWAPGLVCEIFRGDLTNRTAVRIDPNVDSWYGSAPPDLGDYGGVYYQRWTGLLLVPRTAEYKLKLRPGNSRMDLWLDGAPAVTAEGRDAESAPLALAEGLHEIKLLQKARKESWVESHLEWFGPEVRGGVNRACLFHNVPHLGTMGPFAKLVPGALRAEYFADDGLEKKVASSFRDGTNFDLKDRAPCTSCPADGFSIRYSGYIQLPGSDKPYEFELNSDDSGRLVVNDKTVIDEWDSRGKKDKKRGSINLGAGLHKFVFEYRHGSGNSYCWLKWVPGGWDPKNSYDFWPALFFREAGDEEVVSRSGYAPGLEASFYEGEKPGQGKVFAKLTTTSLWVGWGKGPPHPNVPPDSFSGVWRGKLLAPESGTYDFSTFQKGGLVLTVGSATVVNNWKRVHEWQSGTVRLPRGPASVKIYYFKQGGDSEIRVYWRGPGFGDRVVGPESLVQPGRLQMAMPWRPGAGLADAGAPRGPIPARGNRVQNGGFEERDEDSKFASRWTKGQWGDRGAKTSIRLDRTNPHGGTMALSLRALEDGARPGASATVRLDAGTYEVRYWACAAVGETATIGVHLSGQDLPEQSVGDQWKRFTQTVEVKEKNPNAALRLWTSTPKVQVLFDDVEVEWMR